MAEVKLMVLYPVPTDIQQFENDYREHLLLFHQKMNIPNDIRPYTVTKIHSGFSNTTTRTGRLSPNGKSINSCCLRITRLTRMPTKMTPATCLAPGTVQPRTRVPGTSRIFMKESKKILPWACCQTPISAAAAPIRKDMSFPEPMHFTRTGTSRRPISSTRSTWPKTPLTTIA